MPEIRRFSPIVVTGLFLICAGAYAQTPGGPPAPNPDLTTNVAHSQVNVGYYAATQMYRYHGSYNVTYNAVKVAGVGLYGFGDVDVEVRTADSEFQPDRLLGTFEIGGRKSAGNGSIGLHFRHQSTHNVDRTDRPRLSWEQVGVRYQVAKPSYSFAISTAHYVHHDNCRYDNDVDLRGSYVLIPSGRNPVSLAGDLHYVGESGEGRSGYVDYWIEPSIALSRNASAFLGYGLVHDIDRPDGRTDNPLMIGLRVSI